MSVDIGLQFPLECTIIRRLNRFVVEIEVEDNLSLAHINNTGRLEGFLQKGNKGFCVKNVPQHKTEYRLFAVKEGDLAAVIDTQFQMKAFERALAAGLFRWLTGCGIIRRNAKLGSSVIDYLLMCNGERLYLEVKSAVLREGHYAEYPDCPSTRGRKHVTELIEHREKGGAATILFMAALPAVEAFRPNRAGDPELCDLLSRAKDRGVDIRAAALFYDPRDSLVYLYNPDLPVRL